MSRRLIYNGPAWAYRNVRASLVIKPSRNLQTASNRARSQQFDGFLWGACAMQNSHCGLSSAGGAATSLRSTRQRARRPFGLSRWSETAAAPFPPACQLQQRHSVNEVVQGVASLPVLSSGDWGQTIRHGPTDRMGQSVQAELNIPPPACGEGRASSWAETQINSATRAKSEDQLRAWSPCRVGERRGVQGKSARRGPTTGPGTKAKLETPGHDGKRGRTGTRRRVWETGPSREIKLQHRKAGWSGSSAPPWKPE